MKTEQEIREALDTVGKFQIALNKLGLDSEGPTKQVRVLKWVLEEK
jgi:hypothetical protein